MVIHYFQNFAINNEGKVLEASERMVHYLGWRQKQRSGVENFLVLYFSMERFPNYILSLFIHSCLDCCVAINQVRWAKYRI